MKCTYRGSVECFWARGCCADCKYEFEDEDIEKLQKLFFSETTALETKEWRKYLPNDKIPIVEEWDKIKLAIVKKINRN